MSKVDSVAEPRRTDRFTSIDGAATYPLRDGVPVTGVGLANGDKVVLIKNNTGTAANLTGARAATTVGPFATDTTTNTLVRVWSVGDGSAVGFSGTDKFGAAIAAHDVVLRATINSATTITGDRSAGQTAAIT